MLNTQSSLLLRKRLDNFEIEYITKMSMGMIIGLVFDIYISRRQVLRQAQKDSQVKQLFALLGSVRLKALRKHIDEIDPRN